MTRAAAKNHAWVGDRHRAPTQYDGVLDELRANDGELSATRPAARSRSRRSRAPPRTTPRSCSGSQGDELLPQHLVLALERTDEELRYGENPHQQGARYRARRHARAGGTACTQHSGLALSYLNLYDTDAAWRLVHDLGRPSPACAIIKHANPCGVAVADDLATAYQRALECDERSAFGGIVALNRPIDAATVERMVAGPQADVVIAPGYDAGHGRRADREAQEHPAARGAAARAVERSTCRQISGGFLVQDAAPLRGRRATTGGSSRRSRRPTRSGATPSSRGGSAGT